MMRTHIATTLSLMMGLLAGCQKPAEQAPAEQPKAEAPAAAPAAAAPKVDDTGPVKIGILHSLSGTMAISETSLKDVALMTIEEINAQGGLLGSCSR
jgi:ABC-type branched-subunit amino acid transport system substrate-binding protein